MGRRRNKHAEQVKRGLMTHSIKAPFHLSVINVQKLPGWDIEQIEIPQKLICSISFDLMTDPITNEVGMTYQRCNYMQWIAQNQTDPCTRKPVSADNTFQVLFIKNEVREFIENQLSIYFQHLRTLNPILDEASFVKIKKYFANHIENHPSKINTEVPSRNILDFSEVLLKSEIINGNFVVSEPIEKANQINHAKVKTFFSTAQRRILENFTHVNIANLFNGYILKGIGSAAILLFLYNLFDIYQREDQDIFYKASFLGGAIFLLMKSDLFRRDASEPGSALQSSNFTPYPGSD